MTERKRKPAKAETKTPSRSTNIQVSADSEDQRYAAIARALSRPEVGAAATIERWQPDTHDVNELAKELAAQVEAVNDGDLKRAEGMLLAQAHVLNEIFGHLMRRAMDRQSLNQWEAYMRMGMKAQAQCRTTLEALAEMKNPRPVAFVRQANIANGPQQVVNGAPPVSAQSAQARAGMCAGNSQTEQNKLLEQQHGQWLDTGTTGAASGADSQLEAVGAIQRAEDQ